jgi:sugar O-acyltransferase (sialic acid O-acetyltransferase NeuD family)
MDMTTADGQLLVLGAGALARVCAEVAESSGATVLGYLDDNPQMRGTLINGKPVLGALDSWESAGGPHAKMVLGIGNNMSRASLVARLRIPASRLANVIHRSATIMPTARIGVGNAILPYSYLAPGVVVGSHVIINNGVTVDHDCVIEDFASISPGSSFGGRVHIGKGVFAGVGVIFKPRVVVGEGSIIGAGAAVVSDIPPHSLAYGVPARVVRKAESEDWKKLA